MKAYKTAINLEWTSKCNARCVMCPQGEIQHPMLMQPRVFARTLERLAVANVFRVVIAGYGEPTTHPKFMPFIDSLRGRTERFDMVSNGHLLDRISLNMRHNFCFWPVHEMKTSINLYPYIRLKSQLMLNQN